jgi:hypothetical protein
MALMVERVVDGGVHAEEALGGCSPLEPLHLALSPTHDLVGVLGPISSRCHRSLGRGRRLRTLDVFLGVISV